MPIVLPRSPHVRRWHPVCTARSYEDNEGLPVSHLLALPPAWESYPAPYAAGASPLPGGLRNLMPTTRSKARTVPVAHVSDAQASEKMLTWDALLAMADRQIVIASLGAFATLVNAEAPRMVSLREQREAQKPACAKVECSNYVTRGFALEDAFPNGWRTGRRGECVQRYLRNSDALRAFCRRHQLITMLSTETDSDAHSHHPVCLLREGRRGLLLVIDLEPPPDMPKAAALSPYASRFAAQALGWLEPGRGQYAVAPRSRQEVHQLLAQLYERFPLLEWMPTDGPKDDPPLGWVRLRAPETLEPPPPVVTIGIRTGFAPHEWDIVYGALTFLKQFVRPPFSDRPDLAAFLGRFALQWTPLVSGAALPPSSKSEYEYVRATPPGKRRSPIDYPRVPDVRIDLTRHHGQELTVRLIGGPAPRRLVAGLKRLDGSLGAPLRIQTPTRGLKRLATRWELSFPVEKDETAYDAIVAVDRVVRVLEAVVTGLV